MSSFRANKTKDLEKYSNEKINPAKSFLEGMYSLLFKSNKQLPFDKNPENARDACFIILNTLEEIDSRKKKSGNKNLKSSLSFQKNVSQTSENFCDHNSIKIKTSFMHFVLGTSIKEFHHSFSNFYRAFDTNGNFRMEENEFYSMIDFLTNHNAIGKEKVNKCFAKVFPDVYSTSQKLENIVQSNNKTRISVTLMQGIFNLIRDDEPAPGQSKNFVNYLKGLPIFIGFFSEIINSEILMRKNKYNVVRGITEEGLRVEGMEASLLSIFESIGYSYRNHSGQELSFQVIEKVLLLFKNSHLKSLTQEQVELIITDIKKKYKFNNYLRHFEKPLIFGKKLLNFISYKICVHWFCNLASKAISQSQENAVIEEYAFWNSAVFGEKLEPEVLGSDFTKYARKKSRSLSFVSVQQLHEIFSNYITKIIPLITKQSINNIISSFTEASQDESKVSIQNFSSVLYDLLLQETDRKLSKYILSTFHQLNAKENTNIGLKSSLTFSQSDRPTYGNVDSSNSLSAVNSKSATPSVRNTKKYLLHPTSLEEIQETKENTIFESPTMPLYIERYSQRVQETKTRKYSIGDDDYSTTSINSSILVNCANRHLTNRESFSQSEKTLEISFSNDPHVSHPIQTNHLPLQPSRFQKESIERPKSTFGPPKPEGVLGSCVTMGLIFEKYAYDKVIYLNDQKEKSIKKDSKSSELPNPRNSGSTTIKSNRGPGDLELKTEIYEESTIPRMTPLGLKDEFAEFLNSEKDSLIFKKKEITNKKEVPTKKCRSCALGCGVM